VPGAARPDRLNQARGLDVALGVSISASATGHRSLVSVGVALRVLATAGLGISAYVHLHLAPTYAGLGGTITQEDLFYAQGVVAALVGLWLLATGMRVAWWAAALVGAGSFAAVMLYRYVDVGAIGPLPNMNEPIWFTEKVVSAIAEAGVVVVWLADEVLRRSRR
jgi:hypothetical protein